jgi:hypothetical protein
VRGGAPDKEGHEVLAEIRPGLDRRERAFVFAVGARDQDDRAAPGGTAEVVTGEGHGVRGPQPFQGGHAVRSLKQVAQPVPARDGTSDRPSVDVGLDARISTRSDLRTGAAACRLPFGGADRLERRDRVVGDDDPHLCGALKGPAFSEQAEARTESSLFDNELDLESSELDCAHRPAGFLERPDELVVAHAVRHGDRNRLQ